jgi:multiple sugar transport system permease protein
MSASPTAQRDAAHTSWAWQVIPRPAAIVVNGLLAAAAAIALFPLLWMLAVSFMSPGEASAYPPPLVPAHPTFANYRELFAHAGIGRYLANSVLLAVAATALSLVFNVMAGYAFAKLAFRGRERLFKLMLGALVIPGQVAMVPLFLLLKHLGLVNTYGGVIVPALASIFGIFLVRQYALSIPDDLLEAARIDGASEWRIFGAIVVPLLSPIIGTLAVFTLLGTWNDFMWPLIVLSDQHLYTLPVALASLSREHVQDNELMMAGSVLTTLPVLVVFLVLQRYYIQGLMMGGVKG